jgi:hypothetical protein
MKSAVARQMGTDHDVAFAPSYAEGVLWLLAERKVPRPSTRHEIGATITTSHIPPDD